MIAERPGSAGSDRPGRRLRAALGPGSVGIRRSAARLVGRPGPPREPDRTAPPVAAEPRGPGASTGTTTPEVGEPWTLDPPIDPGLVMFESFEGHGTLCSPLAIFQELVERTDLAAYRFVWSLRDETAVQRARSDLAPWMTRVELVIRGSDRYRWLLGRARFLVNNHGFPSYFAKQPGQTYVNTWHGMPLKKMGFDLPNGQLAARSTLRNFLAADYLISSGPAMTARLYDGAYRLRDIHGGQILEIGTPRIDAQVDVARDPAPQLNDLRAAGLAVAPGQRVVLIAPTWKGRSFRDPTDDTAQLAHRVAVLAERLGPAYAVLLKVHQTTYERAAAHDPLRTRLVSNHLPTNAVLGVTDVLVSDYSSVLVDFLVTGRPVILHRPDVDGFDADRGLYPEPDLPGPTTRTLEELVGVIEAVGTSRADDPTASHAAAYRRWAEAYASSEDGQATRRLVDTVFGDPTTDPPAGPRKAAPRTAKTRLLIYLGGIQPNGITTAALALLRRLDYDRFSVVAHFEHQKDRQDWARVAEIPPEVVQLIRTGPLVAPKSDKDALDAFLDLAELSESQRERALVTLDYEWRRCFGLSTFDHVIDFSGYSALWAAKLARSPTGRRAIWLHNDLGAEVANPDKRHAAAMPRLFAQHQAYDALVSVSPELARVNAARLATAPTRERFTFARNAVDAERVLRLAYGPQPSAGIGGEGGWSGLATLVADEGARSVRTEISRLELQARVAGLRGSTTFVTIGRLSPEKNHTRLLEAFAVLQAEAPSTRLLIVGDGERRAALEEQVRRLDLDHAVVLLGHLANPYVVLAAADCFVLSSDYEGLPMVLLEARVLGVPVLSTRFATVDSAVPAGTGLVVDPTVDALARGMQAAVRGEIPRTTLDVTGWNAAAVSEFCTAIGVGAAVQGAAEAFPAQVRLQEVGRDDG